eukprot:gene24494-30845_t
MVASAIITLHQMAYCSVDANGKKSSQLRLVDKDSLCRESLELLQILARLPPNLHAVSQIVSSPSDESSKDDSTLSATTVQQVRVGYALFLGASAVNHSCRPNSAIRFQVDRRAHDTEYTIGCDDGLTSDQEQTPSAALRRLMSTFVEVSTTDSLARGDEVTASYGPMQGKHDVDARRQCLRDQYLFDCYCHACSEDLAALESTRVSTVNSLDSTRPTGSSSDSVADSIHLCRRLEAMSSSMTRINAEFSVVSQIFQRSRDNASLMAFERQRLIPLRDGLQELFQQYFPQSHKHLSTSAAVRDLYLELCGVQCNYLDLHAHIHALRCEFSSAATMVQQAIQLMVSSGQYRDDDVVIGRERVKLAQLQLSGGDAVGGRVTVDRAVRDLEPFVARDDPDWMEANSMLSFLTRGATRKGTKS